MRLIPSSLYDHLLKRDGLPSDEPMSTILDANIPDDLKVVLFQEQKRNENLEDKGEKEKPLRVTEVGKEEPTILPEIPAEIPQPPPPRRHAQTTLEDFLDSIDIRSNNRNEMVIKGRSIPGSRFARIILELSDGRRKRSKQTLEVLAYLASMVNIIPSGVFSKGIMNVMQSMNKDVSQNDQTQRVLWDQLPFN